jgi:hypothetical protein
MCSTARPNVKVCLDDVADVSYLCIIFKGLGLQRRKVNFCMQLRSWLGQVKATRLLEDIGFPYRRHCVSPVHQSSVRVNGVFLNYLIFRMYQCSSAGVRRSEARSKMKASNGVGKKKIDTS